MEGGARGHRFDKRRGGIEHLSGLGYICADKPERTEIFFVIQQDLITGVHPLLLSQPAD